MRKEATGHQDKSLLPHQCQHLSISYWPHQQYPGLTVESYPPPWTLQYNTHALQHTTSNCENMHDASFFLNVLNFVHNFYGFFF